MKKRKLLGIESLKSRYGLMFVAPWIIGFILFFAIPLFQSALYSLSTVSLGDSGFNTSFVAFDNFIYLVREDPDYLNLLSYSILTFVYSLPIILVISLIIALILNQKFRGRMIFRSLFFLPVIISSGVVLKLLFETTQNDIMTTGVSESLTANMFSISDIVHNLNLPVSVAVYVQSTISNIFDLIWSSGIQIILFIAGLQAIPTSIYEACKVEGATKWEEFWFVTFPMLSRVTLLVGIFTMIELYTNNRNWLIRKAYKMMSANIYDESSAMLWLYFIIVGAIMGILIFFYAKYFQKRWE